MLRFDYVVFDFDGTVADTREGILNCAEFAFERMGLEVPDREALKAFCGPALIDVFMNRFHLEEEFAFRMAGVFRARYSERGCLEASVYPGIAPLLRALKAAGAYVAIASSKPQIFLDRITARFDIAKYFDRIVGTGEEGKSSDKRENLRRALPEGADLDKACMIGDRFYDIVAGSAVGVHTVGALYGESSGTELRDAGAEFLAASPEELFGILLPGEKRPRGRFISFEGADGCGKSTQLEKAEKYLKEKGYDVVVSREPGGCPLSEAVRALLLDTRYKGMSAECEALLFAAARAEHVLNVVRPAVEAGRIVLCDRYLDSSFAYQAAGRELGYDFIRQINKVALGMPTDRTLLFEGRRETVSGRLRAHGGLDRIEAEQDDFVRRVYEGYREAFEREPGRIHIIDSDRSIEAIFEDVRRELDDIIEN